MKNVPGPFPELHILVCTNERVGSETPSCAPTITQETVKALKQHIREQGMTNIIQCTRTGCLGFCNRDGGVALVHPTKRITLGVKTLEDLKAIVDEEKAKIGL